MAITIKEPYVVGEKSTPLVYQYLDANGAPISVAGWAAEFHIQERFGSPVVLSASIVDGPNGKVEHVWTGSEFSAPGEYSGQFWVGDGNHLYASVTIKFKVAAAIGSVPLL